MNASFGATSPENSRPAEQFVIPPNFAYMPAPGRTLSLPGPRLRMLWRVSRPIRSRSKPPGFILPCQPALADRPPSGPGWLHEIKFDGYRVIARKDGEQVRLWARTTSDYSKTFKEALVGDQVTPEALCVVTDREIAAGGMLPDGGLRTLALGRGKEFLPGHGECVDLASTITRSVAVLSPFFSAAMGEPSCCCMPREARRSSATGTTISAGPRRCPCRHGIRT